MEGVVENPEKLPTYVVYGCTLTWYMDAPKGWIMTHARWCRYLSAIKTSPTFTIVVSRVKVNKKQKLISLIFKHNQASKVLGQKFITFLRWWRHQNVILRLTDLYSSCFLLPTLSFKLQTFLQAGFSLSPIKLEDFLRNPNPFQN